MPITSKISEEVLTTIAVIDYATKCIIHRVHFLLNMADDLNKPIKLQTKCATCLNTNIVFVQFHLFECISYQYCGLHPQDKIF